MPKISLENKVAAIERSEIVLRTFLDTRTPNLREAYITELRKKEGNVTQLARDYHIPRSTVYSHFRVLGIDPEKYRKGVR